MGSFNDALAWAREKSRDDEESIYIGHYTGNPAIWELFGDGDDGAVPEMLLLVDDTGSAEIVENRGVPYDEVVEALRCLLKSRENAMHAATSGNGALFDAAQEDVQEAVRKAQAILYKLT